jgi:3-(methylthio)propanoyl-CoA dehydrogenase
MNGARIGIAAQSLGIGEAAYRIARDYAASREQFGGPIENLPAVRDIVIDMKIAVEESRALLYETCQVVDHEIGYEKILESDKYDKDKKKETKQKKRMIKRYASMLTPMSKYIASEMCNKVAYDSIQILGGSGFMRDYACERLYRDARITSIYEGTSQLLVVAAVRGVSNGTAAIYIAGLADFDYDASLQDLLDILTEKSKTLDECVAFVKNKGIDYMDLYGKNLVDIVVKLICGYLFCQHASSKVDMESKVDSNGKTVSMKKRKAMIAKRYITRNALNIDTWAKNILSGCTSSFEQYNDIAGAVPELA